MLGKNRGKRARKQRQPRDKENSQARALNASQLVSVETIPRWLTSKFSGIRFADKIEPPIIENIMNGEIVSSAIIRLALNHGL